MSPDETFGFNLHSNYVSTPVIVENVSSNLSSTASNVLHEEVIVFFGRQDGGCRRSLSPFVEKDDFVSLKI
jgi:hypothetical protein